MGDGDIFFPGPQPTSRSCWLLIIPSGALLYAS